jgi:glycosyltransferase involved in cell wall biosynthesis
LATIAKNEQDMIGGMLSSVGGLADEIIIGIDDKTTDDTAAIVQAAGGKTFSFTWSDDFAAARNLTLDRVTGDWVLVIDPDARLTLAGRFIIRDLLRRVEANPSFADGFMFLEAELDLKGKFQLVNRTSVRLFRNDAAIRYRGIVHEEPWVDGRDGKWQLAAGLASFEHYGYCPERMRQRGKHDLYVRLCEQRLMADPDDVYARNKLNEMLKVEA